MRCFLVVLMFASLTTACARNQQVDEPQPMVVTDSVVWNGDPDLAPVLVRPELTPYVMAGVERLELRVGPLEFLERLGTIAEDTTAPWLVRLNALRLLARRGAIGELPAFVRALEASDERVRIAAVAGMREFMSLRPETAIEILAIALRDKSPRVQSAALQMLGDRDVQLVREFHARTDHKELRAVALDLIRAAEERGAPLVAMDEAGTLERTTRAGAKLSFRPTRRWPGWDAAVGDVIVTLPGKKPVIVAAGVEVVGNVVPAFFAGTGKTLVYELNREIRARDLETGDDRKLADGIAPRILPFTEDIIYYSEIRERRGETANSFTFKYNVMRVPVAGGTPASAGQIGAIALNELKGNYSTVRWSRVEEREGEFYLVGEMIEDFRLPSPF
ncbi:MAG: HEAT repeat domain-containing protein [Gemmatimonadota bacterium]